MPMPRSSAELNAATHACKHCTPTGYCSYHTVVNDQLAVEEGQRIIRESLSRVNPSTWPKWVHRFQPFGTTAHNPDNAPESKRHSARPAAGDARSPEPFDQLTLEEKLVASIAIANYRKEKVASWQPMGSLSTIMRRPV